MLLGESITGTVVHATTIAVFSTALFLLVIARLWGILQAHQEVVQRERILRSASDALVAAQSVPEMYAVAMDGVRALVGSETPAAAAIYFARGDEVSREASLGKPPALRPERWLEAAAGGALNVTGLTSVTAMRSDTRVRGILVVDSIAPMTLDQHGALAMLATQVGLAVESANLSSDLRKQESEARFRNILQNTSDIIVIVNAQGAITYGTPSLGRVLDQPVSDLVGRRLPELLSEDDDAAAMDLFAGFAGHRIQTTATTDWRLRRPDGSLMAFEVLPNNMLADPGVRGIVLTMRDVSERRELEGQLKHQAFHDALTGLANRALFGDRAEHALARTATQGTVVAMVMLDLDDFKIVNDTRGHAVGDALLVELAHRLQAVLRVDATVARFGGDEFAILVEDLVDAEQAERFARRTLKPFATPFLVQGEELTVHASVGLVVTGPGQGPRDMSELMRCADLALYAAKERGKGQIVLYQDDMHTQMVDRFSRRADLERGLAAQEFVLYFQPIVVIDSGEVVGCEALVRWQHPTRGVIPPMDFVPLAEESGLIVDLGSWVLDQACAQIGDWNEAGHPELRLSVNVSARQLHETGFVSKVQAALSRHDVHPAQLVLELTESLFALDAPAIGEQIKDLRALGVKIAMDDFGTGYSSLSYLQKFQLDVLKIDKSFVDELNVDNPDGAALVNAIITLASSLRLEVVAEGVEHAAQRDELWSMGCNLAQGYLYSVPLPSHQMTEVLASRSQLGPRTSAAQRNPTRLRLAPLSLSALADTGT